MSASNPYYFLFSDAVDGPGDGRWRFVLCSTNGTEQIEADELEPGIGSERLELLAVVRGLEALDQPSRVTLVTSSAYVREGIRHGLVEWRKNGWCWEFFGQMVPVKNRDLWKRVDRALSFHTVECRGRNWRFDPPHSRAHRAAPIEPPAGDVLPMPVLLRPTEEVSGPPRRWQSRLRQAGTRWKRRLHEAVSALVATPRFG